MDKIKRTWNKNKKNFILCIILWLFFVIVFVMPVSTAVVELNKKGEFNIGECVTLSMEYIQVPFSTFFRTFTAEYFSTFLDVLWKSTLAVLILIVVGISRNRSKGEYENIEHGSSDWSKSGEQYKILSRTRGIILAEDNYLPIDKRGNVNVLVVGRFWFW